MKEISRGWSFFRIFFLAYETVYEKYTKPNGDARKRLLAASFVAVRNMTGMNRKEFAEWLAIPYRTMQDWELGTSQVLRSRQYRYY